MDFKDGGVSIPSCNAKPLAGGGNSPTAQCTTIGLSAGPHNIVATYGGDVGNSGSSSAPLVQQVDTVGGALVSNLNPAGSGQLVTFTLTIMGNNPSGWVNFRDDGVNIPSCTGKPLTGVGNTKTAQCAIATLAVGTHPITADYGGDRVNPASTSNTVNEVITPPPPTTTTLVTSQTPQLKGQAVIFTATVTGTAAPTGTVTFKDGASTITGCSASVVSGGGNTPTATCGTSGLSVGTHSITATYNGDLKNASSVSAPLTQDITCIPGRGCPVP